MNLENTVSRLSRRSFLQRALGTVTLFSLGQVGAQTGLQEVRYLPHLGDVETKISLDNVGTLPEKVDISFHDRDGRVLDSIEMMVEAGHQDVLVDLPKTSAGEYIQVTGNSVEAELISGDASNPVQASRLRPHRQRGHTVLTQPKNEEARLASPVTAVAAPLADSYLAVPESTISLPDGSRVTTTVYNVANKPLFQTFSHNGQVAAMPAFTLDNQDYEIILPVAEGSSYVFQILTDSPFTARVHARAYAKDGTLLSDAQNATLGESFLQNVEPGKLYSGPELFGETYQQVAADTSYLKLDSSVPIQALLYARKNGQLVIAPGTAATDVSEGFAGATRGGSLLVYNLGRNTVRQIDETRDGSQHTQVRDLVLPTGLTSSQSTSGNIATRANGTHLEDNLMAYELRGDAGLVLASPIPNVPTTRQRKDSGSIAVDEYAGAPLGSVEAFEQHKEYWRAFLGSNPRALIDLDNSKSAPIITPESANFIVRDLEQPTAANGKINGFWLDRINLLYWQVRANELKFETKNDFRHRIGCLLDEPMGRKAWVHVQNLLLGTPLYK